MAGVTVEGLPELLRALRELPREIQGVVAADALRDGARVIVVGAQRRAPRRKGKLAAGITATIETTPGALVATIATGKREFYGRFLEFGTVKLFPRGFMRRTLEEDGPTAFRVLAASLARGIEQAARQVGLGRR